MKHQVWMLILMAAAGSADAAEYWSSCNSCSEPQAQRAALWAAPAKTFGRHHVYVADFSRGAIRKYVVWSEYEPELGGWRSVAWPVVTESYIAHEFAQLVAAMKTDVSSLESGKRVPRDIVGSAYDLVHSSLNQQRVADYIISHMSLWESIGAPVFVPLSLFRKVVDLNLTIPVAFADGSTASFVLTGVSGSLGNLDYMFELVDGSARDPDGNLIPGRASEAAPFEGAFSSELAAQRMLDFVTYWYPSSTGLVIECSTKQIGSEIILTCKRS